MTGSISTLTSLQAQIAAVLGEISGLKVYSVEPVQLDQLPAVTMDLPTLNRVDVDSPESEFGSYTWITRWPLRIYVHSDDPTYEATSALQYLSLVIAKFDVAETLNGYAGVISARVTESDPFTGTLQHDGKPVTGYEAHLSVLQLV